MYKKIAFLSLILCIIYILFIYKNGAATFYYKYYTVVNKNNFYKKPVIILNTI